jgi:hypothetical protein
LFRLIVSYNRPHLCANATWSPNATTFANSVIVGSQPHGIFIDRFDQIYLADHKNGKIRIYGKGQSNVTRTLSVKLAVYTALFVTLNGDVYFEHENKTGRIDKWSLNSTNSTFVTKFRGNCYGLFVDINNTLYCSLRNSYTVEKVSLDSNMSTPVTVTGTGIKGSASDQFDGPWGIFVDTNLSLYVADADNKRVMMFRPNQLVGQTVAGNGIPNGLQLLLPTDVIMDGDGYLYIAENRNHRIVRTKNGDYVCLVGCSGRSGSAAHELNKAYGVRLDSRGNLYVVDEMNRRIQRFQLIKDACGKSIQKLQSPL